MRPVSHRAAIAAAPYIHPKLAASVFKGEFEGPIAVKLSLDYSRLEPHEMTQLLALIEKAQPRAPAEPLMIDGEVEDGSGVGRARH
jgi:hypothetical protein